MSKTSRIFPRNATRRGEVPLSVRSFLPSISFLVPAVIICTSLMNLLPSPLGKIPEKDPGERKRSGGNDSLSRPIDPIFAYLGTDPITVLRMIEENLEMTIPVYLLFSIRYHLDGHTSLSDRAGPVCCLLRAGTGSRALRGFRY
jgi:hypothetical protein